MKIKKYIVFVLGILILMSHLSVESEMDKEIEINDYITVHYGLGILVQWIGNLAWVIIGLILIEISGIRITDVGKNEIPKHD